MKEGFMKIIIQALIYLIESQPGYRAYTAYSSDGMTEGGRLIDALREELRKQDEK